MCIFIDMESEASSIVRTNFVGIVGDVRRDMEGHHYRYFIDIRSCGRIHTAIFIFELKVNYECMKYSHFVFKASEGNMMMIFVLLIEFRFVKMTNEFHISVPCSL